jgi:fatty-acyl-CoA synthase
LGGVRGDIDNEVPVAFVARRDERLTANDLFELCRRELAGYKRPKDIRFVAFDALPRSTTGKIQRHEVESWLQQDRAQAESGSRMTRVAGK